MKQVLQHVGSGELEVADVAEPACTPGGVVVRNVASLISTGTEKSIIGFAGKSLIGKAQERPDLVRKVLDRVRTDGVASTIRTVTAHLDQTVALGYSCAGVVEAVGPGAEEFSPGESVACAGMGYASHAGVVFVPTNLAVPVPVGVSLEDASYVTLGAIALQGIRIAAPTLGECIVVIGLGVIGQLTVQMLRANGCRVVGVDLDAGRVERARTLGADLCVERGDDVSAAVARFTNGIGADAVIVTAASDSADPIELAGELCRDRGRVSVVGAVAMSAPRETYYAKELELRLSRSYGPGRYDPEYEAHGHDYPIGYVRWTERRNMQEFLRLVAAGHVTPAALTTHRFPVEQAAKAYDLVAGRTKEQFGGIVLQYTHANPHRPLRTVELASTSRKTVPGTIGVGVIGAGGFASSTLLPRLAKRADMCLVGVATAHGLTAANAGKKFEFSYATTDANALIADDSIRAVIIATRHASHPALAAAALRAGKDVFVEKPLAIDEAGLTEVIGAQRDSGRLLAVGFNRRFSSLAARMKNAFIANTPLAIDYRVNAGHIPADSWIHDSGEGGGRIVGEVCHFIDFCSFITGDLPRGVFAYGIGGAAGADGAAPRHHETVNIVIKYDGGSIATINYFTSGDASVPKERVEVFGDGRIAVLDDFRELRVTSGGRTAKHSLASQDKGFDGELDMFFGAIKDGSTMPITLESLVATTRATFAIMESLRTGTPSQITL